MAYQMTQMNRLTKTLNTVDMAKMRIGADLARSQVMVAKVTQKAFKEPYRFKLKFSKDNRSPAGYKVTSWKEKRLPLLVFQLKRNLCL